VVQALYRWQPVTKDHGTIASGESVAAGMVLWISARTNAVVAVRGSYVEPTQWDATGGETFVAAPALEAQPLSVPAGVSIWRYDTPSGRWQAGLPGDLAALSDLPSALAPGEAIFIHSNDPVDLGAPASEERVRYYHQDHLGSGLTWWANGHTPIVGTRALKRWFHTKSATPWDFGMTRTLVIHSATRWAARISCARLTKLHRELKSTSTKSAKSKGSTMRVN